MPMAAFAQRSGGITQESFRITNNLRPIGLTSKICATSNKESCRFGKTTLFLSSNRDAVLANLTPARAFELNAHHAAALDGEVVAARRDVKSVVEKRSDCEYARMVLELLFGMPAHRGTP